MSSWKNYEPFAYMALLLPLPQTFVLIDGPQDVLSVAQTGSVSELYSM
jgi:hypothetical protein